MKSHLLFYLSCCTILALGVLLFFTGAAHTIAATNCASGAVCYTPLEPLPGLGNPSSLNFASLLGAIFRVLITVGALIAVASLVWGGIAYMLSEAFETKGEAKRRMQASIWGLLILAGSYLILNTINPELVKFNLSLGSVNSVNAINLKNAGSGGGTGIGGSTSGPGVGENTPNKDCPKGVCITVSGAGGITFYSSGSGALTPEQNNKYMKQYTEKCKAKGMAFVPTGETGSDEFGNYAVWSCKHADGTYGM